MDVPPIVVKPVEAGEVLSSEQIAEATGLPLWFAAEGTDEQGRVTRAYGKLVTVTGRSGATTSIVVSTAIVLSSTRRWPIT